MQHLPQSTRKAVIRISMCRSQKRSLEACKEIARNVMVIAGKFEVCSKCRDCVLMNIFRLTELCSIHYLKEEAYLSAVRKLTKYATPRLFLYRLDCPTWLGMCEIVENATPQIVHILS